MAKYIQATMSAGVDIEIRANDNAPIAKTLKVIHINGGANVRDRKSILTPIGAMTEVSDKDYEDLEKDQLFQQLKKNGYIVVRDDHHLNVKDNEKKDKSAPKTPQDYEKTGKDGQPAGPTPTTEPETSEDGVQDAE